MRNAIAAALVGLLLAGPLVAAEPQRLADYLPSDAAISYLHDPSAVPGEGNDVGGGLIHLADRMGLVPDSGKVLVNLATAAPIFGRYPHAITLLDVSAERTERDAVVLSGLRMAMVFWAPDGDVEIRQAAQTILSAYIYQDVTRSTWKQAGKFKYQELRDSRLPGWLTIELGRVGKVYVISLGEGSFARIAAIGDRPADSLARDPWYAAQMKRVKGERPSTIVHSDWDTLRRNLEKALPGRVDQVARGFETPGLSRVAWAMSFSGRKLYSRLFYREADKPTGIVDLSDPDCFTDDQVKQVVPDSASYYGVARMPVGLYYKRMFAALSAALPQRDREKIAWGWKEYAGGVDASAGQKLADSLGPVVWIHDWPAHPLGVPGACTVVADVRNSAAARQNAGALIGVLTRWITAKSDNSKLFRAQVRREGEDPAWYLSIGLLGPAVRFTDRHMILSWSPTAARQNADHVARGD